MISRESLPLAPVFIWIVLLGYFIGSIPFGLLAGRLAGIDIRQHGSGNIGATNVWRVLGRRWGLPVFLLDVAKGLCAALLGKWIADHWAVTVSLPHLHTRVDYLATATGGIAGAMASILGHNFPLWLRFKGGKGVATSLGVLFGLMPLASTITFVIWAIVFKVTHYVSLASIIGALSLPLTVLVLLLMPLPYGMVGWAYFYFVVVAAVILVLRHTSNIRRLIAGTERRMGEPREEAAEAEGELPTPAEAAPVAPPPPPPHQATAPVREPEIIDAEWVRVDEDHRRE